MQVHQHRQAARLCAVGDHDRAVVQDAVHVMGHDAQPDVDGTDGERRVDGGVDVSGQTVATRPIGQDRAYLGRRGRGEQLGEVDALDDVVLWFRRIIAAGEHRCDHRNVEDLRLAFHRRQVSWIRMDGARHPCILLLPACAAHVSALGWPAFTQRRHAVP